MKQLLQMTLDAYRLKEGKIEGNHTCQLAHNNIVLAEFLFTDELGGMKFYFCKKHSARLLEILRR